jgi:putative phage-type endonuclease
MDDLANIIQGTDEWHKARLGRVTASRVCDVVARTKTGWGASRANYMAELIAERLTGVPASSYTNAAMMWGTEREPDARAAYASQTFDDIREVGFVVHPTIGMAGASPDGLVGGDGLVEIKCPTTATHLDTLLGQNVPDKYILQIQWQLACSGRAWADFVSYDPRLPPEMQLFVKRIDRDDKRIGELEETVSDFLDELAQKIERLTHLYKQQETA